MEPHSKIKTKDDLFREIESLQTRLCEAEETLHAIRSGEVDALVVESPQGEKIYTLAGADSTYRDLVEQMSEGAARLCPRGLIIYANSRLAKMLGTPLEKVIGTQMRDYIIPDYLAVFDDLFKKGKDSSAGEVALKAGTNLTTPAQISSKKIITEEGENFYIIVTDLSELKIKEKELRDSALYCHTIIEVSPDPLFVVSAAGRIIDLNRAAETITGLAREKLVFSVFADCFTEPQMAGELYKNTFIQGFVKDYSLILQRSDDTAAQLLCNASLYENVAGETKAVIVAARDMSELKRVQEQLQRAHDDLEFKIKERTMELNQANKELESFSYSISHDLQAPLRAIDGYSRMIMKRAADKFDDDTKHKFDQIRAGVHLMGKLIEDILAFSRCSRKEMTLSSFDMKELIAEVWDELGAAISVKEIDLIISELPACLGDRNLIKQVLVNLLANAIKFTRKKDARRIEACGYEENGKNVYFVKDNGIGFDMAYKNKLFGVFQRLHSADEFEGTGVGLAIVSRIVQKHGGHVWADAEVDKGACFYFALPQDRRSQPRD